MPNVSIFGLLYGSYFDLHKRFLDCLESTIGIESERITLWCNIVCDETREKILSLGYNELPPNFQGPLPSLRNAMFSQVNVPKYHVIKKWMREMTPILEPWTLTLDDDTWFYKKDWLQKALDFAGKNGYKSIYNFGWVILAPWEDSQWEEVKKSSWFRGKEPMYFMNGMRAVKLVHGAYIWLRTNLIGKLDYPDVRMNHNDRDSFCHTDWILGEQIRQAGLFVHHFNYGVTITDAPRRGIGGES